MLLVCSGEDSYRSLEKARELEAVFKQKYDPAGSSVERLVPGKAGVEALLSSLAAASLFAPRRFFRVDGLVTTCPKDRLKALIQSLERDVDATVVVTVEDGELSEKVLKPFKILPKFIQYDRPLLPPAQFQKWCAEYAIKYGVKDTAAVRQIAEAAQGDVWTFVSEFQKWKAGGELISHSKEPSVYDVIDSLLISSRERWTTLRLFDDANAVVASAISQARSLVLVKSGLNQGVHPYVAQKLSRMKISDPAGRYVRLATAFVWSRTGRANADEAIDIFG